jgi:hypothetical protein
MIILIIFNIVDFFCWLLIKMLEIFGNIFSNIGRLTLWTSVLVFALGCINMLFPVCSFLCFYPSEFVFCEFLILLNF